MNYIVCRISLQKILDAAENYESRIMIHSSPLKVECHSASS